jgi:carboxyl-terminal processing protease
MNCRKKLIRFTAVALIFSMILPLALPLAAARGASLEKERVQEVLETIERLHVSGISEEKLSDAAIEGMISALNDPYTEYMSAEEWEAYQSSLENSYVGIGVAVGEDEKGFYVAEVFPSSPAEKGGMKIGDYIVSVNGVSAEGKTSEELVGLIKGPEGSAVTVTIERGGKRQTFTLKRGQIEIPVVTSHYFSGNIGYIRLTQFSDKSAGLFSKELDRLSERGMKALIVDLRGNPGGYLHAAQDIAARFIKDGVLIHTLDRNRVDHPVKISGGKTVGVPVTVLVDKNSASAAEVLAGALQDYKLATVVGTTTFGKGSVQRIIPLRTGGVLKITVEEYLTPRFRKVNQVGITPDIAVSGSLEQLAAALYASGAGQVELEISDRAVSVNGVSFPLAVQWFGEDSRVFIPSRLLAALVQADAAWEQQTRTIQISGKGGSAAFSAGGEEVRLKQGVSYIDIAAFQEKFPQITWSVNGRGLVLSAKGK